jgi:hypothetical protein
MITVAQTRDFGSLAPDPSELLLVGSPRQSWPLDGLRRTGALLALCVGLVCLLWASAASATPLNRVEDGRGIKVGERSTFHPGFALATGVDTNVFYEDSAEGTQAAAFMVPTAWAGIGNRQVRDGLLMSPAERSGRILDYNISGILGFRQYLARRDTVLRQSRLSGGLQLRLHLLPGRRFSAVLDEDFFRYAQPSNYDAGADFNFNRIDHRGALTFYLRPGGGRLSFAAGYRNQLLRFQNPTQDIARGNRMVNGMLGEIKWRFLPKSSVLFQYTFDYTLYLDCCQDVGAGRNEDSFAHRIQGGYRGQILKKVTFDALVGWGLGFYRDDPNGPNFGSFIGQVGFNYYPGPRSVIHASVYRQFQDSLLGNYFTDIGGRVAGRHQFRWNMIAGLGANVLRRRYSGLPVPSFEDNDIDDYEGSGDDGFARNDTMFILDAKIEQPLGKIWALALTYDLTVDAANYLTFFTQTDNNGNRAVDIAGYNKSVLMLLAAVRM